EEILKRRAGGTHGKPARKASPEPLLEWLYELAAPTTARNLRLARDEPGLPGVDFDSGRRGWFLWARVPRLRPLLQDAGRTVGGACRRRAGHLPVLRSSARGCGRLSDPAAEPARGRGC